LVTIAIVTGKMPSLRTVASDIADATKRLGHDPLLYTRQIQYIDIEKTADSVILLIPFDPLYAPSWLLLPYDAKKRGKPALTYVTVEGLPKPYLIPEWIRARMSFIANSQFTKQMLEQANIRVSEVIPHGINLDQTKQTSKQAKKLKERLKSRLGAETIFGTIASDHPRKALPLLAEATKLAEPQLKDTHLIILTTFKGAARFKALKNATPRTDYGKLTREEVLTLTASFDYLIQPSMAEGFCLPILEAQALGVPIIHPDYAPLTEISHPEANLTIEIYDYEYKDFGNGILYRCSHYSPQTLAKKMIEAHSLKTQDIKTYKKMSQALKRHAKKYSHTKTYTKLLHLLEQA